jgi:uncharacterized RmlC-like cupin family protein
VTPDAAKGERPHDEALYQLLTGVLFVALIASWVFFDRMDARSNDRISALEQQAAAAPQSPAAPTAPRAPEDALRIVDVVEHMRANTTGRQWADISDQLYESPKVTVHLHAMAPGQTCPLHIHRTEEEVTVIASGVAKVTQRYGDHGKAATKTATYNPGSIIESGAFCGHEWLNPSDDAPLGNLVFSVPAFDGNFYVGADDPRLLRGKEPFSYDPTADLEAAKRDAAPSHLRTLPVMGGRMKVLVVKTEADLPVRAGHDQAAYVLVGSALLGGARTYPAHPGTFALYDGKDPVHVRAVEGPAALLLFDPDGPATP